MAAKKKTSRKKTAAKKAVSKKKAAPRKKSAAKKATRKKAPDAGEREANDKEIEEKAKPVELEVVVETAVEATALDEPEVTEERVTEEPKPSYVVPDKIDVNEFRERSLASLLDSAAEFPLKVNGAAGKSALIFELLAFYSKHGTELEAEGILEQAKENYAMLRDPKRSFRTSPDDFYVGGNLLKQHGLRAGQKVRVKLRAPRERDKYLSALEILTIAGAKVTAFDAP